MILILQHERKIFAYAKILALLEALKDKEDKWREEASVVEAENSLISPQQAWKMLNFWNFTVSSRLPTSDNMEIFQIMQVSQ